MGNDGFDDDFYKIFKKYKLDFMDELNLREEVQNYTKKRFVSKDKIREVLEKYKYTEIVDSMKIIAFYKAIQELLERRGLKCQ